MARPTKLTEKLLDELEKIADNAWSIKDACNHIGISEDSWRRWETLNETDELLDRFRGLVARVRNASSSKTDDLAWGVLREAMTSPDVRASDKITAASNILRLRTAHRVELTGRNGNPIQVGPALDLTQLTTEELQTLYQLTEKAQKEPPRELGR